MSKNPNSNPIIDASADTIDVASPQVPRFFRRMAIISYDAFLLLAVLFVATLIMLPFSPENSISSGQILFQVYLFVISFAFYGWFWTHGGQTLGLRAWKTTILDQQGEELSWQQAFARFCWAILSWAACGLGFIWIIFDKDSLAWHDKLSKTQPYYVKK